MAAKLIKCKSCGADIAANAKTCPQCGAKNKKPFYKIVFSHFDIFDGNKKEVQ